jgi:LmbE family N-acetylglucosaminyl deacetylase
MVKSENLIRVSLLSLLTSLLATQGLAAPAIDTLRLKPHENIVIVAPHPDDEVLACGGLIQQALALGDSVWVVYVTSGDGSWPSAWRVTGNLFPGHEDYLELGRVRIDEAKAGAALLGLDTTSIIFLGYPDAGLTHLWQQNWDTPYRSAQTQATADPYGKNGREYSGRRLLNDLDSLLRTVRPTRVFTPHQCDAHPDHWATAMLIAIARETGRQSPDYPFPDVYCYLIHRPPYPEAQTDDAGVLSPPDDLVGPSHHWFTIRLNDKQRRAKQMALGRHDSQHGTFGSDIYSYVSANELFDRIVNETGPIVEDAPRASFVPAARFSSVEAHIASETLDLRVSLRAEQSSTFTYALFAHAMELDTDSVVHSGFAVELTSDPSTDSRTWSARIPWSERPGRGALLYSAEVRWGTVLLNHSGIGRIVY